jgi:hypothetical protein
MMYNKIQLFIASCLLLLAVSCQPNPEELKEKVLKIKDMSELGTVEYTVTKMIRASDDKTWYKFGSRKILFSCEARIKAGVDLSQVKPQDVKLEKDKLTLNLPKAKIIYITIAPDKIKEEYKDVSIVRSNFSNAEKDNLLVQGEKNIQEMVPSLGILETAEKNTRELLTSWLRQCDFKTVEITFN